MPNQITAAGIQTESQSDLISFYTAALQAIYGADVNIDPDSPDGQIMLIWVQHNLDILDFIVQVYNSFDPDNAIGVVLDQRVALNGIQRLGGTFTTTDVTLTITGSINIYGLDQTAQPIYTVADNAGNQWQLVTTVLGATSGAFLFQAAVPGNQLTIPNTITVPVTIILGVTAINNPNPYVTLGTNEESDAALRIRRQKSSSLSSQGYLAGLYGALLNIQGVTFAFVEENNTGSTNSDGVPGHSIWVIVSGTAAASAIANAIYTKRNAGCGMYGAQSFTIIQLDGTPFIVHWDNVTTVPLFIKFTAYSLDGVTPPNITGIKAALPSIFLPGPSDQVNIGELGTFVSEADPNTLALSGGFSVASTGPFTNTLTPVTKNLQFVVEGINTIILPMILFATGVSYAFSGNEVTGTSVSVAHGGNTLQFSGLGGFGTLVYTKDSGAGSINSSTGLYTSAGAGTDVVRVTDSLGDTTTCTITVT